MKDADVLSFLNAVQKLRKPEYDAATCLPKQDKELADAVRAAARHCGLGIPEPPAPRPPKIHYSADDKLYYVTDGDNNSMIWLGTERMKPDDPRLADLKKNADNMLSPKVIEQTDTLKGITYWQIIYPFNFWKIEDKRDYYDPNSRRVEPITREDDYYKDYAAANTSFLGKRWEIPA